VERGWGRESDFLFLSIFLLELQYTRHSYSSPVIFYSVITPPTLRLSGHDAVRLSYRDNTDRSQKSSRWSFAFT